MSPTKTSLLAQALHDLVACQPFRNRHFVKNQLAIDKNVFDVAQAGVLFEHEFAALQLAAIAVDQHRQIEPERAVDDAGALQLIGNGAAVVSSSRAITTTLSAASGPGLRASRTAQAKAAERRRRDDQNEGQQSAEPRQGPPRRCLRGGGAGGGGAACGCRDSDGERSFARRPKRLTRRCSGPEPPRSDASLISARLRAGKWRSTVERLRLTLQRAK